MFQRIIPGRSLPALAVAAGLLVSASTAVAAEKGQSPKPLVFKTQVINVPSAAAFAQGTVAQALRAQGGKTDLRKMTAEEARELGSRLERAFRLNRSTEGLKTAQAGNGLVSMNLEGRFVHVYLARKEADGSITTACVTDWASAEAFLRGGAVGASQPVKE